MKKLLSTALIAVLFSTIMIDTINAAIERRPLRRTSKRQTTRRTTRRTLRKKRNLPAPRGKTSPEQLKKTAQQAERDTKKLQDDAKKSQTGKTSKETVVADAEKIEVNINKIEQQLANLRTWSGDVLPGGYSLEEKNKAFEIAKPYIKVSEALKVRIKRHQSKIDNLTTKTYFGFGTPTVKQGKEKEYNDLTKLIKIDEARLAKFEPIIAQQEVIMGKRRSTAIKAAYGVMATAAIAVGADLYTGGALSGAAATQISSIASNVAYYTPSFISSPASWGASKIRAGWDYLRGNKPADGQPSTSDLLKEIGELSGSVAADSSAQIIKQALTDEFISKAVEQSALSLFGQELYTHTTRSTKAAAFAAISKGISQVMNAALVASLTYVKALVTGPTTDPKVLQAELKKLDVLTAKAEKEAKTKK